MHASLTLDSTDTAGLYRELAQGLRALLAGETDPISNAANMSSLIYWNLSDLNWAGFYFVDRASGDLLVGPFQGKPACVRIPIGKGVCGTTAERRETVIVRDVHEFPGHIACDSASNSEVVVPILAGERLIGVLDLDSPRHARFDDFDARGLEALVRIYVESSRFS